MIDHRTPLERIADAVHELTTPRSHREPLAPDQAPRNAGTGTPIHGAGVTHGASLLAQLEQAIEPSGSTSAGHRVPTSTPAARMAAMNALLVIDTEVSHTVLIHLGHERPTLAANLHALVGAATGLAGSDLKGLAYYATRWHTMAAIATGWEVPPVRLHNTCPLCTLRDTVLIRLDPQRNTGTAYCAECHETWDETTIGLLAEHVRAENREDGADVEPIEAVACPRPCNCEWTLGPCAWCRQLPEQRTADTPSEQEAACRVVAQPA